MNPIVFDKGEVVTRVPTDVIDLNGVSLQPTPVYPVEPARAARTSVARITEQSITDLGGSAVSGMSSVSNKMLASVRTSDADQFGEQLTSLVRVAKHLDPAQFANKGLVNKALSLVSSTKDRMLAKYTTVDKQMEKLVTELDKRADLHRRRITDFDTMYNENVAYHQGLEQAVALGQQHAAALQEDLNRFGPVAETDSFAAQEKAEIQRLADRLDKRIDDLRRAMLLSKQQAPQLRILQDNARGLVEKFGDVKAITLPAYKNAFSMYLLHMEQKQTVQLLDSIDESTDDALRRGADGLRQNAEAIARSRQRSVVTYETLEHVQRQLIGSVEDVARINAEGRALRKENEPKLLALEKELVSTFAPGQR